MKDSSTGLVSSFKVLHIISYKIIAQKCQKTTLPLSGSGTHVGVSSKNNLNELVVNATLYYKTLFNHFNSTLKSKLENKILETCIKNGNIFQAISIKITSSILRFFKTTRSICKGLFLRLQKTPETRLWCRIFRTRTERIQIHLFISITK